MGLGCRATPDPGWVYRFGPVLRGIAQPRPILHFSTLQYAHPGGGSGVARAGHDFHFLFTQCS